MSDSRFYDRDQAKRIQEWIKDLASHHSCELAPSEPSSSEKPLSQIGSSHIAISERLGSAHQNSKADRAQIRSKRTSVPNAPESSKTNQTTKSSSTKVSSRKNSSRGISTCPAASADGISPKSQSHYRSSHGPTPQPSRSEAPRSSPHLTPSYPTDLDPYSIALNERLFHEHRQVEDRARSFVIRRPGELRGEYNSRINGRLDELDDNLVDLNKRWRRLEMEQQLGLRPY